MLYIFNCGYCHTRWFMGLFIKCCAELLFADGNEMNEQSEKWLEDTHGG